MKKRILAMIFVLALCFCTVIPAFAVDADGFVSEYERVQDMAKLLSESEREALIKNARRAQRTSENGCNSRDDQYVGRQKAHGICRRYL